MLCSDAGSGRAQRLAQELGGEALRSNAEVAQRVDLVVLCHKPAQLDAVAREIRPHAKAIASVLGATSLAALESAYPEVPVIRLMPNTPVEVGRGTVCFVAGPNVPPALEQEVVALFARLGMVLRMEERFIDVATAVSGVGPAYEALLVEAQVDAAVRHGLAAGVAARLVVETMAGTAMLLAARGYDTLAVRREVASPGGGTARGLAALERGGLRSAFQEAIDAVVGWSRG